MKCARAVTIILAAWSAAVFATEAIDPISGRVVDASSGQPVAGVQVVLVGWNLGVSTDRDGCFAITPPAPGRWTVRASHEGFQPVVIEIAATAAAQPASGRRDVPPCAQPGAVTIALRSDVVRLQELVVVTAGRTEEDASRTPRAVSMIDRSALHQRAPRTTPESLTDLPGVFLQKTSHGSGAPYVRGLIGNQVLVLVDGIRLNNSTFRYGPNQYLATMDPGLLERLEVVRGPGSVMFGSDAIGGVVNLLTRRPALSADGVHGSFEVDAKVMSSGMEQSGRVRGSVQGPSAAMAAGAAIESFGDLVAGGSLGVERPSGYGHVAADAQVLVRVGGRHLLSLAHQFDRQDDVPRWDQIVQRGYARYSFAPQQRQLSYGRWQFFPGGERVRAITATGSFQRTRERREIRRAGSATSTLEQDVVETFGLSLDATGAFGPDLRWVAGGDWYHDDVRSWRRDTTESGLVVERRGLYPAGATAGSAATFGRATLTRGRWRFDGGTRATVISVAAGDPTFGAVEIAKSSLVSEGGLACQVSPLLQVVGNVAQSFRAPNIDDVSTLGRFDFGVEVPSPNPEPERAVTVEGGLRLTSERAAARVVVYRTRLHDLIDRVRGTFEGVADWEGESVYRKANVGDAVVRGIEAEGEWRVTASLTVLAHATYTHGQNTTRNEPMRRIPPVHGLARAQWRVRNWWMDGTLRWATAQTRLAAGDRDDHRIPPGGTPGWSTVSLSAGRSLGSRFSIRGGIANVFDAAYRTHGSGIDGAGRAAWLALRHRSM